MKTFLGTLIVISGKQQCDMKGKIKQENLKKNKSQKAGHFGTFSIGTLYILAASSVHHYTVTHFNKAKL